MEGENVYCKDEYQTFLRFKVFDIKKKQGIIIFKIIFISYFKSFCSMTSII